MTPDEAMSAGILLEALERHIAEALRREGLPPLHRRQFQRRLRKVQLARQRMGELAVQPA